MGYGWANSYIIYGWCDKDNNRVIKHELLEENGIGLYATEMYKNHAGSAIYGIICEFNKETGCATISDENKMIMNDIYNKIMKYYGEDSPKLGFYLGVDADMSWDEHEEYVPEIELNDGKEELNDDSDESCPEEPEEDFFMFD